MSPRISIVTPVYNPPLWALEVCISSVLAQTEKDWQWCIADDQSTDADVRSRLLKLAKAEPRVNLTMRDTNGGIVEASNSALATATGEFVALLDHDDSLTPDALAKVLDAFALAGDVDYVYSDEDKIDREGHLFDEFRKPSFAPERLRGQNYCCHISAFRRSILDEVGGFRGGFDGSQDWDLVLRVTEKARRVVHIPQVLYHWRVIPGSTSGELNAKPYVFEAARRAVSEHCDRLGIHADISTLPSGFIRCARRPKTEPLVSIIIPTRGDRKRVWGVETCLPANAIRSILKRSTWANLEIVLVHDRVSNLDRDLIPLVDGKKVRILWYDKPFDFSDKCNLGVLASHGDIVVLLNDDTEVETPEWIELLVAPLEDGDVAMTGPMTRFEDGRIQSAGHGNLNGPHNLASREESDSVGPFGEWAISREVSGITGACAAIPRTIYMELGGMSPAFPHSYNDVDFGFKALRVGYRMVWTPYARLWHFESLSRDPAVRREEVEMLYARWGDQVESDNFTRTGP